VFAEYVDNGGTVTYETANDSNVKLLETYGRNFRVNAKSIKIPSRPRLDVSKNLGK